MNLTKPQQLIYDMEKFSDGAIAMICGSMLSNGERDLDILRQSINEIYRINEALRIRISETDWKAYQKVMDYSEQEVEVLHFDNREALDAYAEKYAKIPLDLFGNLCEIKIVFLPGQYGLLAKLHHIVGDAWTLALIGTQFHNILEGKEVEAYAYTDYVESERLYFQSKRYEKDKEFFVEQFKKCDEVTYLNEKQSNTFQAERKTCVLDVDKTNRITNYAKQNNTSAFILFTAALSIYMNRIKMNAEKFYIGTAVLNRNGVKEKNTAGMFINTVPMLMELDNEKTFAQNLTQMQDSIFSIMRHQKYNYGDVLATIRKEYGFQEKLYDVMISYQNAKVLGENSETTWYHSGEQSESLQIHIDDRDNEGIFRIHYDYLVEKFTEHEIDRLHEHICNLLFDAIENDSKKIYELDILSLNEKNKLLYEFNDTAVDYPKDKCIHQLFEEQVSKTPDKVAVIACDKTFTYRELNEQANRIAHSLIDKGIGVGDIVAFALPRKSYLIATILGILKSGAAYLPIDPDYPQDRIDYMLADSNARMFVTEESIMELLVKDNTSNLGINMSSNNLCYCIYTSGSTGKPKGALLKHSSIVNLIINLSLNEKMSKCKRVGFLTIISFDVATQEIFSALLNGMTGVISPDKKTATTEQISAFILENKIDLIYVTPTYFDALTNTVSKSDNILRTVTNVILAGEEFYINDIVRSRCEDGQIIFTNHYGPAETHVVSGTDIYINSGIENAR